MAEDFSVDNVVCITHDNKSVSLFLADGKRLDNTVTYYHIIRIIGDKFVRVNKNIIVNLAYAVKIDEKFIYMANDNKFNIDSEYLKNATNEFYKLKLENFLPNG